MIKTVNLGKMYGKYWAVRDLNLTIEDGEIYGFLGPNGAGKTTTILMILSILKPTVGDIYLFGDKINGTRISINCKIGVVSEKQYVYPEMTLKEYLYFFGELYRVRKGKERIEELAERLDLTDSLGKMLRVFSRGMQQKVGFMRALLQEPELLILDEPVSGLDPIGISQVRKLIEEEKKMGKTIFISSHLLSEIEQLCDRIAIISKGQLLVEDRMENIIRRLIKENELRIELSEVNPNVIGSLKNLVFVNEVSIEEKYLIVTMKTDRDYRRDVIQILVSQGIIPLSIKEKSMSLEDAFLTITKENMSLLTSLES